MSSNNWYDKVFIEEIILREVPVNFEMMMVCIWYTVHIVVIYIIIGSNIICIVGMSIAYFNIIK